MPKVKTSQNHAGEISNLIVDVLKQIEQISKKYYQGEDVDSAIDGTMLSVSTALLEIHLSQYSEKENILHHRINEIKMSILGIWRDENQPTQH